MDVRKASPFACRAAASRVLRCLLQPVSSTAKRMLPLVAAAMFAAFLPPSPSPAQDASGGGLHGTVTDPSGAAVPGASVEALNVVTQIRRLTQTDAEGRFAIPAIPVGTYQVTTRAQGFSAKVTSDVEVAAGKPQTLDVRLAIRSVGTEVNVQATIANIPDTDINIGPLPGKKLSDLPFSVTVLPAELIENQQATSLRELIKYMPSVQIEERGGSDVGRPQTRGFEGDVVANARFDGMNIVATTAHPMEMFDRLEVLNGLSGSLNGPAQPAGSFNFIVKRPTDVPLRQVTVKYDNQNSPSVIGDFGGKFGKDKQFGYRLVALYGDGEGFVDGSDLRRGLASLAFDWRFLKHTVAEVNFSYYAFEKMGFPGGFSFGGVNAATGERIALPEAFDASTPGYGQKWGGSELYTHTESGRVRHDFNQNWHLTAGVLNQSAERGFTTPTLALTNNAGGYRGTVSVGLAGRHEATSNIAYVNGAFATGDVKHEISAGTNGFVWRTFGASASRQIVLGTGNINTPTVFDRPDLSVPAGSSVAKSGDTVRQALSFSDTITFNDQWSALLSINHSWLSSHSFDASGNSRSTYSDNGMGYGASLMYKPVKNITVYYTYADTLEAGKSAPTTAQNPLIQNPGEILPPYRSNSHEAGIKAELSSRASFTLAGFRIERPFAYTDPADNVFKQAGTQRNFGLEIMATGDIFDDLTAYGGITLLDPRLKDTGIVATSNKWVVGAPKVQANLLLEYRLHQIPGLSLNMNWHHTGKRAANDFNTMYAAGYHTVDLGARFTTRLEERFPITWRFEVDNVGNSFYWASIFPGSTDGTGSTASAFLGPTRTFMASMQVGF
jgi:iron complex outermembrane receptor protein